ncbi:Protoglobin-domain-containing protein [Paraphysoderma sedebokerense]|nr:Protoglobin-domain-containing protein [Paraphysoderma sedebokerense]
MERIDRTQLYSDLLYRFTYVAKFVDFGDEDKAVIKKSAAILAPLVPTVVDAVYKKLFSFDITKSHFLPKMEGFEGNVVRNMEELKQDSEQIKFRKDMLSKYLVKLVTAEYDEKMVKYLDWVAKIHVAFPGKKSRINVEYIHVNALMGYVENILISAISECSLDASMKKKAILAFNKLLWIQNDLFAQYYVKDGYDIPTSRVNAAGLSPRPSTLGSVDLFNPSVLSAVGGVVVGLVAGYFANTRF